MEFKDKLLLLLKEKNITQRELAEKINIDETAMSRFVKGTRTPRMLIIVNIARALDVPVEYLIDNDECQDVYSKIEYLVCRNLSDISDEQREKLIEILSRKS